ncbi:hypothetical protein FS837_003023 [Tulasnella sp. UAMH 9824]|nr:hypothetical protein FS837_003023 [Tulasnella sp. UAMH 9824]
MTMRHLLILSFAFLWPLRVHALPADGPTRTTPPRRTFVLTARAQASSTAPPLQSPLSPPAQTAVTILAILLFAAAFAFLIAKKCGVEFHCNHVKKALARRSRGQKPAPSSPPPTVLPMEEHHVASGKVPVAEADPTYGKLDGWAAPPAPPKEAPRQTVTSYVNPTFSKLDGYAEEPLPRSRPPSATPPHTDSTPTNTSIPPPHPTQPQNSDSWKQGTVVGATTEGWKQ